MTNQMPVISTSRNVAITDKKSSSLISRGLSAILNKETGLTLSEQDARYRQARDIYNRITDYGMEDCFDNEMEKMSNGNEQFDLLEDKQLHPFFTALRQLVNILATFQKLADQVMVKFIHHLQVCIGEGKEYPKIPKKQIITVA